MNHMKGLLIRVIIPLIVIAGIVFLLMKLGLLKGKDFSPLGSAYLEPLKVESSKAPAPPGKSSAISGFELELTGHDGRITALVFTPDGKRLLSACYDDYSIRIWNSTDGSEMATVRTKNRVTDIAISQDGRTLYTVDAKGTMLVWDIGWANLTTKNEIEVEANNPAKIAISPNGKLLVVTGFNKYVSIVDVASGKLLQKVGTSEEQRGVAFSSDCKMFATGGYSNKLSFWNLEKGRIDTITIPKVNEKSDVWSVDVSPDGKVVATGHMDSSITMWDAAERKELLNTYVQGAATSAVKFSPDGSVLATGNADKKIYFYDTKTKQQIRKLSGHEGSVTCLAFSRDGLTLASGSDDKTIILWR